MPHSILEHCFSNAFTSAAKRVMENIQKIEENPEELSRRIFWELLQNATDALPAQSSLDFQIEYDTSKNLLIVSHSGRDFTMEELANLCIPDSSKEEIEDTVGTYGTGFLSTHAMSAMIEVSGAYTEKEKRYKFTLSLDRSDYSRKKVLAEKMRQSAADLDRTSKMIAKRVPIRTTFTYHLSKQLDALKSSRSRHAVARIIEQNLEEFHNCIPYAVLFRGKPIKQIRILKNGVPQTYTFTRSVQQLCMHHNGQETSRVHFLQMRETTYAVPVNAEGKIQSFDSIPKLFCFFPLVGTESFFCPVIIHHPRFSPTERRNDIARTRNQHLWNSVIIPRLEQYLNSLSSLTETYRLLPAPQRLNESHWTFNTVLDVMKRAKIVSVEEKPRKFCSLQEIVLPDSQQLYDLVSSRKVVPIAREYEEWKARCQPFLVQTFYTYRSNRKMQFVPQFVTNDLIDLIRHMYPFDFTWYQNALRHMFQSHSFVDSKVILNELSQWHSLRDKLTVMHNDPNLEELSSIFQTITNTNKKSTLLHPQLRSLWDELSLWRVYIREVKIDSWCRELNSYVQNNWTKIEDQLKCNYRDQHAFSTLMRLLKENNDFTLPFVQIKQVPIMYALFPTEQQGTLLNLVQDAKMMKFVGQVQNSPHREKLETIMNDSKLMSAIGNLSIEELKRLLIPRVLPTSVASSAPLGLVANSTIAIRSKGSCTSGSLPLVFSTGHANFTQEVGDLGEKLVYQHLCKSFGQAKVSWSSKNGEDRFDFCVIDGVRTIYVEAKSTSSSVSETTTMFFHPSQWQYMKNVTRRSVGDQQYWIARCFNVTTGNPVIDYVQLISKEV